VQATRPVTYRLPRPGVSDCWFGCSRAYYYQLDKRLAERGEKLLIRSCAPGRSRGVTLVRFAIMEKYVLSLVEGEAE
jgi:hypothetical protein